MHRLFLVVFALVACRAALADERLDLAAAQPVASLAELVVHGTNQADGPRSVVIRVDDQPVPDYANRANEERLVPPGAFTIRLRLASLRTPRGRALDRATLRQAIVFAPQGGVVLAKLALDRPAALPPGTFGWFFGPDDAAPLDGFTAIGLHDPAISGPSLQQVHRPGSDPILAWGTRLTRFAGSLPPGHWHLTLWTEDPGEWETLPKVLERRIRLNGADLLLERRSDAEWVDQRYLAGRAIEADPAAPPFATLGARRGGRVEADVDLPDGHFVLELAGFPQASTHLAAITASPSDRPLAAAQAIEAVRAARFAETWPVIDRGPWQNGPPPVPGFLSIDGPDTTTAAPGGMAIFRLDVHSPAQATAQASLEDSLPGARILWGMWRWRRPAPDTPGLVLSAAHLRADADAIPLRPDLPRPLVVLVPVAKDAPPGRRTLRLALQTGLGPAELALHLDVLAVKRPEPRARVGAFLDLAPQLAFAPDAARRQSVCDLDTLRGLGLTAVSPPIATPGADLAPFLADLRAAAARFPGPFLAYSAARRVAGDLGVAEAGAAVARADAAAIAAGLAPPIWTVADEPSAAGTLDMASELANRIRLADRNARLAGHLNDPADSRILQQLDVVTVNPRYGADAATIAALREAGREVWLYNMPRQRLASGFYLWRSLAAGLLQWHARMPTADAFDPTDGREGDVQFLWPTPGVCQAPDLDADLLELVEGEEDLRWLAWLDARVQAGTPGAAALQRSLRAEIPGNWDDAALLPTGAPSAWRGRIMQLARSRGVGTPLE